MIAAIQKDFTILARTVYDAAASLTIADSSKPEVPMTRILGALLLASVFATPAFAQGGAQLDEDIAAIRDSLAAIADTVGGMAETSTELDARLAALEGAAPDPAPVPPPPTSGLTSRLCGMPKLGEVCVIDFETGSVDPLEPQWCCPYSGNVVGVQSRDGSNSLRLEVRKTDPDVAGKKRSQILVLPRAAIGSEYWYGFSTYLSNDWVADPAWEVIMQWHQKNDAGEPGLSPPLSFVVQGGGWAIMKRWDSARITRVNNARSATQGRKTLWRGSWQKARWVDFVLRVRWSYDDDGLVQVWKDGVKIVDEAGPIGYDNDFGPRMVVSLYKGTWPDTSTTTRRVVFFDAIRIAGAEGNYGDVAPR